VAAVTLRGSSRTVIAIAFVTGALMHLVASTLGLVSVSEAVRFFLTPGGWVAREIGLFDRTWSAVLNVGFAMIANGLLYAVAVGAVVLLRARAAR
jgi:hypothetical protein